jgi:hypothetical protein
MSVEGNSSFTVMRTPKFNGIQTDQPQHPYLWNKPYPSPTLQLRLMLTHFLSRSDPRHQRTRKNDEAQKHEKTETLYQSANFVTVDNNPNQLKSQNNFLSRRDPNFGEQRKMHHAYLLAARTFSPSP